MSTQEFEQRWQAAIDQAQAVYLAQRDTAHQELQRRRERAGLLLQEVSAAFRQAAEGRAGLETRPVPVQPNDLEGHLLIWKLTEPTRSLVVMIQPGSGQAYYALVRGQNPPLSQLTQLREFDVLQCDEAHLEELILRLADQAGWGEDRIPEAHLPEPDPETKLRLDQLQRDISSQSQARRVARP